MAKGFAVQLTWGILAQGPCPRLSRWIHGRARVQSVCRDVTENGLGDAGQRCGWLGGGGRGHQPRDVGVRSKLGKAGKQSLHAALRPLCPSEASLFLVTSCSPSRVPPLPTPLPPRPHPCPCPESRTLWGGLGPVWFPAAGTQSSGSRGLCTFKWCWACLVAFFLHDVG